MKRKKIWISVIASMLIGTVSVAASSGIELHEFLKQKEDYGDFYAEEIGKEYEENQSPEELAVPVGNEFTVDLQN